MRPKTTTLMAVAAMIALAHAPGQAQEPEFEKARLQLAPEDREQVETLISEWPETPRNVAGEMMDEYGMPDEMTTNMLVWNENGPWNRTIVYREEVDHRFPMPHKDVLEQFIDYRVPPEMFDELAAYDGSVIVERTKGVISARCDKEAANFLALNLANDVVTGQRSVEEARQFYGETIQAMMRGESPEYTLGLVFDVPEGDTGDPDEAIIEAGTQ